MWLEATSRGTDNENWKASQRSRVYANVEAIVGAESLGWGCFRDEREQESERARERKKNVWVIHVQRGCKKCALDPIKRGVSQIRGLSLFSECARENGRMNQHCAMWTRNERSGCLSDERMSDRASLAAPCRKYANKLQRLHVKRGADKERLWLWALCVC